MAENAQHGPIEDRVLFLEVKIRGLERNLEKLNKVAQGINEVCSTVLAAVTELKRELAAFKRKGVH